MDLGSPAHSCDRLLRVVVAVEICSAEDPLLQAGLVPVVCDA